MRVFSVPSDTTYKALKKKLEEEYHRMVAIVYEDDEGDSVTVRSEDDLEEAFAFFASKSTNIVKFTLQDQENSSSNSNQHSNSQTLILESKSPELPLKEVEEPITWQRGELLGIGGFGSVYKAMNTKTGQLFAVKQVKLMSKEVNKAADSLSKEISLLQSLKHGNIVRYLGSERTETELNIFMEYVSGGSIAHLLSSFGFFPERVVRNFTKQILTGLEYLHLHQILHRDIKGG